MWKAVLMGSAVVLGGTVISRFFTFLYSTILIRELSVADFAFYSLFMSIFSWILIFSHFDLYAAVSKLVSEYITGGQAQYAWEFHYNASLLAAGLSIVGVTAGALISAAAAHASLYTLLLFFSLIPLSLVTVNDGLLKGYQRFALSACVDISGGFSKLFAVSAFILLICSLTLNDVFVLFALASAAPLLVSVAFTRNLRSASSVTPVQVDKDKIKRLLSFSKWVCMTDLANTGMLLFLNFMLSFHSYEDLARFNVVVLIYSVFQLSYGAITTVAIPKVAGLASRHGRITLLGRKEINYLYAMAGVIALALHFLPYQERILELVFKKTVYSDALHYVAILLLVLPLRIVTMTNKGILQGLEHPSDAARASVLSLLFLVAVSIPFYRLLHFEGIIVSLLLAYILEFFLYSRAARVRTSSASSS